MRALPVLTLAALTTLASAHAATFQFDADGVRSNSGRLLIPCVKVALGAMASPRGIEQSLDTDEAGRPVIGAVNEGNNYFSLTLSVQDEESGQPLRILPPGPCRAAECMNRTEINLVALAADGTPILLRAAIASPGGTLDPSSIYAFNPQPEPPGDASPLRVDFRIRSEQPASAAYVTLSVVHGGRELTLE